MAAALGTSRTTLIKLMDDLDLPRAMDLGAEEITRARAQAGGDLDAAARIPPGVAERAEEAGDALEPQGPELTHGP